MLRETAKKEVIDDYLYQYYDLITEYLVKESRIDESLRHIANEAMHASLEALKPFVESYLIKFYSKKYPGKDWEELTHDRYHSEKVGSFLEYEKNKKNLAWDLLALLLQNK